MGAVHAENMLNNRYCFSNSIYAFTSISWTGPSKGWSPETPIYVRRASTPRYYSNGSTPPPCWMMWCCNWTCLGGTNCERRERSISKVMVILWFNSIFSFTARVSEASPSPVPTARPLHLSLFFTFYCYHLPPRLTTFHSWLGSAPNHVP
jgi:hypothetical protein